MSDDESGEETAEEPYDSQKKRALRFDVYVQWNRGDPHQHEESIRASDQDTALMLAKRNVEFRREPLSLRVVPRSATKTTKLGDPTLSPGTDRSYRMMRDYPTKEISPPTSDEVDDEIEESEFTET